jgi:protein-S-isoprenylcysteine O-methyltransferase Ste14
MYVLSAGLGFVFFAWLWFLVMVAFIPLWSLECKKEEKEMIELYGPRYIDYQKRTGMFFPKVF